MPRPRKTNEEHRRNGNPSKLPNLPDEADDVELRPIKLIEVPQDLGPSGAEMYQRIVSLELPWHSESDLDLIHKMCQAQDNAMKLVRMCEENGWKDYKTINAMNAAEDRVFKCLQELGLTPVSRSKLGIAVRTDRKKTSGPNLSDFINKEPAA